jgi:hypothetical protein
MSRIRRLVSVAILLVAILFSIFEVPRMPRTLHLLRFSFDLLPDLAAIFLAVVLAAVGIALLFLPEELKRLEEHRRVRVFIAAALLGIGVIFGVGGVVSDLVQKHEEREQAEADRNATQAERSTLEAHATLLGKEVTQLLAEQFATAGEARSARSEAQSARAELGVAKRELSGQISQTETILTTNINQYRSDTTSAVGRMLRPARTLGDKRSALINELKKATAGPHEVAITLAHGNQECLDLYNEIESAFKEAGWTIGRSQFFFITKDGTGLQLQIKSMSDSLRPDQMAVALAFKTIGMQLIGGVQSDMKDGGPVEVYVGLQ